MYSQYYTKSNPGLWVLLTDESEESCWEINKFINEAIMLNSNGRNIMDRCYFHILGYNGCLKVLQTGYLQTFVENQSEIQEVIKQIPDGDGGYFEVKSKIPIWIKSRTESKYYLAEAVNGACALVKDYIYANRQSPAPIVWHFANNNNEKNESCRISFEINKLKQITSIDGNVLFIHVHREACSSSYFAKSSEMSKNCSQFPLAAKLIYKYLFEVEFDLQNNKHGDFIIDNLPLCINSCFISRWIRIFMGYSSEPQLNTDIWNFCKKIVSGRSYK